MLIAWLGCLFFGATICFGVPSFYLDNSAKVRRSAQFKATEQRMLQNLGLQFRPKPKKGSKEKVPQFMLDLYHYPLNDNDWISTDFRYKGRWTFANTIRAFHDEDGHPLATTSGLPNRWNLFFDVSTHPSHEKLTAAELRLSFSTNKTDSDREIAKEGHRLNIFQVLKLGTVGQPAITRLIDSKITTAEGVQSFDIRPAVNHWLQNPKENYGLEVHWVTDKDSDFVQLKKGETVTVDDRPSLVTFSHDGSTQVHRRRRRRSDVSRPQTQHQYCQRHPLYVDFVEVGWDDWIVAPPGYQAYYCNGECPFPIADHLNSTNHAIVQTLMNSANSADVPPACCVPTTLKPINMLYVNEYNKVVLKKYHDMVVDGCGCR